MICLVLFVVAAHSVDWGKASDTYSLYLDDHSFEQLTQAATGATTGDWLVMFFDHDCSACDLYKVTWKHLAKKVHEDDELYVNVARLSVKESPETARRFGLVEYPSVLFLRQGKLYTVKGQKDEWFLYEMLKKATWTQYEVTEVPAERSYRYIFF